MKSRFDYVSEFRYKQNHDIFCIIMTHVIFLIIIELLQYKLVFDCFYKG